MQRADVTRSAIVDIFPLSLATVPWGILCGSLAISAGLNGLQAQLMSLLVFAGAAQLTSLSLVGAGSGLGAIYSSTFVISSRHLLYSVVFREHVQQRPFLQRVGLAFLLTDEMFAVTCAHIAKHQVFSALYAFISGLTFYVIWNLATLIGILAGQYIENIEQLGLEFAIAATFIAIVIPSITTFPVLIAVLMSALFSAVLTYYQVEQALIIATFIGMLSGYFTPEKKEQNHE